MSSFLKPERPGRALRLANSLAKKIGWAVFRRQPDFGYFPKEYGHRFYKKMDIKSREPFAGLARRAIENRRTLLYYDRLYTIFQAMEQTLARHPDASIAEVGVYKGGGIRFMAETARALGAGERKIFACDTFEGHPDSVDPTVDGPHRPGNFATTSLESVRDYLVDFPEVHLIKGPIEETCTSMDRETFAFVHLDVDIRSGTEAGLAFFSRRLIPGGIIVVDDYGFESCLGARAAVDEFTARHPGWLRLHLMTGQYLLGRA